MIYHSSAKWIWCGGLPEKDVYCAFRQEFTYSATQGRVLVQLSADSTFALFVNGRRIPGGQYSDYPYQRTYSTIEITHALQVGINTIGIEVHFLGEKFHVYLPGVAALKCTVYSENGEMLLATDESWKCAAAPGYRSGSCRLFTFQAGYIFEYDMRLAERWMENGYDDAAWSAARAYKNEEYAPELTARPVPQLLELPEPCERLCSCGSLLRQADSGGTPAQQSQGDYLKAEEPWECFDFGEPLTVNPWVMSLASDNAPDEYWKIKSVPDSANGRYAIFDMGEEEAGFLKLKLKACAGTIIDITNGEHLTRGRLLADRGRYNFTDRYICCDGEQEFVFPHRRYGCRYIELHITHITGPLAIGYAGVIPMRLPLPQPARFSCEDGELRWLEGISARALALCMHEHYEDCIWREQALWNFDARIQMFIGYHLWGNYDFAASSLELMRKSYNDGFLALTEPGRSSRTIPMFTLAYIAALRDRLLFGGHWDSLPIHLQTVDKILDYVLERKEGELYFLENDPKRFWHFYEWRGDLKNAVKYPQSAWNLYLCEALQAASELHLACGNKERTVELSRTATMLGKAIEGVFRRNECYALYPADEPQEDYELIQLLMLTNGLVPDERKTIIWKALNSGTLLPVTSANLIFMLNGLMECTPEARRYCHRRIFEMYRPMLKEGASTVWETSDGFRDMDGCGSLCHGWSAIVIAYEHRYLLGVRPLEPGFARFAVKVFPGHLTHAEGTVPTPKGIIGIQWTLTGEILDIQVTSPDGCLPIKEEYPEYPVRSWTVCPPSSTDGGHRLAQG